MADLTHIFGPFGFDAQRFELERYFFQKKKAAFNKYIADLLRSDARLSDGARDFIAGVFDGSIKRIPNRQEDFEKKLEVYERFKECIEKGMTLEQAEGELEKEQPGALKNYQRMKPVMDEVNRLEESEYRHMMKGRFGQN